MHKDERDLLEVLRFELEFVEKGGYRPSPREPRKMNFIFEDSPSCMNYDSKDNPAPCNECVLMALVPPEHRNRPIACRHIPLNTRGDTLNSLYPHAEASELEDVYREWLRATIAKLEEARSGAVRFAPPLGPAGAVAGEALFGKLHPKCANPVCPAAFHWLAGGTFYRFRPRDLVPVTKSQLAQEAEAAPVIRHYWLCEPCAQVYTLSYEEGRGVLVSLKWPELPANEPLKQFPAARH